MKWIIRLYPRAWRERYEEEILAVLELHRSTWRTRLDLLGGAWEAQLDWAMRRKQMTASSPHPVTFAWGTLIGIVVVLGLMLYGILSYPASIQGAGLANLLLLVAGLLAYVGAVVWSGRQTKASVQTALALGARFGAILAAGSWLNMALEHFVPLDATGSMVRGVGMWALMFVTFGAASSAAYQRSGSLGLAVLSSVWSALIGTVATLLFGFALGALFMPYMQQILAGAYAHSGMSDPRAFVIRNTLDSASSHLLVAPLLAVVFGIVGGYACFYLRSLPSNTAKVIGVVELGLLMAGLSALHYASLLARPERPPFVMTGLLALGIAMACAHPVFTAIWRRPAPARAESAPCL